MKSLSSVFLEVVSVLVEEALNDKERENFHYEALKKTLKEHLDKKMINAEKTVAELIHEFFGGSYV